MVSREPDELFKRFVDDFPKLKLAWQMQDSDWSKKIFGYFADLGKSEGFYVYYANNPYEYLLDMCWIYGHEQSPVSWVEVGFEIEFAKDLESITDELAKLIDIKAYTKVLLCEVKTDEVEELLRQTSEMIRYNPFRSLEENYLIIVINETRKRFFISGFAFNCLGNMIPLGSNPFTK